MPGKPKYIPFLESLPDTDECIEWPWRRIKQGGYGDAGKQHTPYRRAHRLSYVLNVGPIPDDLTVDHRCFNAACVNPRHLRLKTHDANRRENRKSLQTHCINGHEFNAENTRIKNNGCRECVTCCRARSLARYRALKTA